MVFCFENCSDLPREKKLFLFTEKIFWDHNSFKLWKVRIIFEAEFYFNLLLEVSTQACFYTQYIGPNKMPIGTNKMPIGTNNSDVETCRNNIVNPKYVLQIKKKSSKPNYNNGTTTKGNDMGFWKTFLAHFDTRIFCKEHLFLSACR